jgi:hypothetical protein
LREKRKKSEKKMERGAGALGIESDEELFTTKYSKALKKVSFVDVSEIEKVKKP